MSGQVRARIPFRRINRRGTPHFDPGLQRHHILPRQILSQRWFAPLIERLGVHRIGFDDFRRSGMLLPANSPSAVRLGLPLHRGPHKIYNAMVIERVGSIESDWSVRRYSEPLEAGHLALFRIALLQRALRRRLLGAGEGKLLLNRRDPIGTGFDFTELDAMAEQLWGATYVASSAAIDSFAD